MTVQSSYICIPTTYSTIFSFRLLTCSLIRKSPVISNDVSTEDHSHYPPFTFLSVIPAIRIAILWRNNSITAIIKSVTNQILLPYRSTAWTTALYIIYCDLNSAPVLPITFATTPHLLWNLYRLLESDDQSLLLYVPVCMRYGNDVFTFRWLSLTLIATWFSSNQRCNVSRCHRRSCTIRHTTVL